MPAIVSADDQFEQLFNGTDLTGWAGKTKFWSVKDGAIFGETTKANPTDGNTFLVWQGGDVGDFVFKTKVRFEGNNSGVQYRSELVDADGFVVKGYQADLHKSPSYFGMLYAERWRGIVAQRFQRVEVGADGKPKVVGEVGDKNQLLVDSDWNELTIIAVGNRQIHQVNGITTMDLIDNHPEAKRKGILGLQLHAGPPMTVEFKDIRLRHLSGKDAEATLKVAIENTKKSAVHAPVFDEKFEHWPVDLKINGRIVVAGQLDDFDLIKGAFTKSQRTQNTTILIDDATEQKTQDSLQAVFEDNPNVMVVKSDGTSKQFESILNASEFVLWYGTAPLKPSVIRAATESQNSFSKFINDGKTLVVIGSPAEIVSEFYLPVEGIGEAAGLNLTPDCVIETNFSDSADDRNRLLSVLTAHPRCVGVGLEPNSLLALSGRKAQVVGKGVAKFFLSANDREPARTHTIHAGKSRNPENTRIDLTQWRRDAIDRTLDAFPVAKPVTPFVQNGTLMIVGGGGLPQGLMEQFIETAGGKDRAKLVFVPCSESDAVGETQRTVDLWKRSGVKHATFIHTKDRTQSHTDEKFLAPLKEATGIWFGGGRQWNFSDSYYGTKAHKLMKDVLQRGGVIGGSSAGASIQARYLARATPISNFRIMAFGYERGGLGFISGVAIDQHFSQRGRQKDMTQLVNTYPQLLGIGIDEATAIIVQKSKAEVVGRGKVHFYDRNQPVVANKPDFVALKRGAEYDLAERKVLKESPTE